MTTSSSALPSRVIRNVLPLGVPAGTFSVTGPSSVGTSHLARRARLPGTTRAGPRSGRCPCVRRRGACPHAPGRTGRPAEHPPLPVRPCRRARIRAPSLTPAGTLTLQRPLATLDPRARHVGQGSSIERPEPWQVGHVCDMENRPWFTATSPLPPHVAQVTGWLPGAAPDPLQVEHGAGPVSVTGTVTPAIASSKLRRTSVSRSAPRRARRRPSRRHDHGLRTSRRRDPPGRRRRPAGTPNPPGRLPTR